MHPTKPYSNSGLTWHRKCKMSKKCRWNWRRKSNWRQNWCQKEGQTQIWCSKWTSILIQKSAEMLFSAHSLASKWDSVYYCCFIWYVLSLCLSGIFALSIFVEVSAFLMNECFDFTCCRDGKTSHIWRIFYYNRLVVVLDLFTLTYSTYSLLSLFSRQILFILVYISPPLNCATRAIRENHTVLSISADVSSTDHDFFHILFFSIQYFDPETKIRTERNELTRGWPSLSDARSWSLTQLV